MELFYLRKMKLMKPRNFKNRTSNNSLDSIETELVAFAGTIIHFKFEFTAKARKLYFKIFILNRVLISMLFILIAFIFRVLKKSLCSLLKL